MFSHLQIILPYLGSFFITSAFSSGDRFIKCIIFLFFIKFSFSLIPPKLSTTILAKSTAIAGEDVSPGDLVPAILKNPFTSSASPRIKSPVSASALSPAKFLILSLKLTSFILFVANFLTVSSPSCVFPTSSLFSTSEAVGPTIIFP